MVSFMWRELSSIAYQLLSSLMPCVRTCSKGGTEVVEEAAFFVIHKSGLWKIPMSMVARRGRQARFLSLSFLNDELSKVLSHYTQINVTPYFEKSRPILPIDQLVTWDIMDAKSICHVCQAPSKSFKPHNVHYGGICCLSCKSFFHRSTFHGTKESFQCAKSNACLLNYNDRFKCQKCRYDKCLAIGMNPNLVLTFEQKVIRFGTDKVKKSRMEIKSNEGLKPNRSNPQYHIPARDHNGHQHAEGKLSLFDGKNTIPKSLIGNNALKCWSRLDGATW